MTPISVCMIAKNEDNHISECLKRLRPCKFEIVVADTGSVDRTVEMASKYTEQVHHFDWCDDFSVARNFSISKASNDWILVVDCDEYLENVNLQELEYAMEDHPDGVGLIVRNNPYTIQGVRSVMSERIGRFFNRKYCHYEGTVHEQVKHLDGSEPETYELPLTLYHEGYVAESDARTRATRNLEMLLHDLQTKGPTPYVYYQLGQNYIALNDIEMAAHYYELGLQMDVDPHSAFVQNMMETYGYCLLDLEEYDKSMALIDKYELYSNHADFVYLTGMIYMKNSKWKEAAEEFVKATTISVSSRKGVNSYRAYYNLGIIHEKLGEKEQALKYYKKCGDFEPAVKRLAEIG